MSKTDQDIVDAIEGGSFQYAQSLLNVKLQRNPQSSYYVALKAYLTISQGSLKEAKKQCEDLLQKYPSDPKTLSLLYSMYVGINEKKEGNGVYEKILKRYPTNENVAFGWFQDALKSLDNASIQLATFALQRTSKTNRQHILWAAISYLSSAQSEEDKQKLLFCQLGLKMMEKITAPYNSQEIYIWCKLLYTKKDYEGVVQLINTNQKINLELETREIYLNALQETQNWEEIINFCENDLIQEGFDDFDTWKLFIRASYENKLSYEETKNVIEKVSPSRNSLLALIETSYMFSKDSTPYIQNYYEKFGGKVCCFYDLKYYKHCFDLQQFISSHKLELENVDDMSDISAMTEMVNMQKLIILSGGNNRSVIEKNDAIYEKFKTALSQKAATDFYLPNELMLSNIVYNLESDSSVRARLDAIFKIEKLLEADNQNFSLRIWLMKLYKSINCQVLVFDNYKTLKIKMVQHDTLSHLILQKYVPANRDSLNFLINTYRFYLTAHAEIEDSLLDGYQKNSFTKLEGFVRFGKRIRYSLSKYRLILEIIRIARIQNDSSYSNHFNNVLKEIEYHLLNENLELYDNSDKNIEWNFGTNEVLNPDLLCETPCTVNYIKLYLVKELLIMNCRTETGPRFLKLFNKLLENKSYTKNFSEFEKWLFKIYLQVFKLIIIKNSKEADSMKNFLAKNLKQDKIKSFITVDENTLNTEINFNFQSLCELTRLLEKIRLYDNSKTIESHVRSLQKYLRTVDLMAQQLQNLREAYTSMPDDTTKNPSISKLFANIETSVAESTYSYT